MPCEICGQVEKHLEEAHRYFHSGIKFWADKHDVVKAENKKLREELDATKQGDHSECLENAMRINADWNKEKARAEALEKDLSQALSFDLLGLKKRAEAAEAKVDKMKASINITLHHLRMAAEALALAPVDGKEGA